MSKELKEANDRLMWLRKHNAYLRTPRWKAKREAVLRRDGYMCQACLARSATQVHHLTYKHWRDEPLFELVSICKPCHEKITAMDNGQYTTDADMDHVLYAEIEF